jgi:hypothetical protein
VSRIPSRSTEDPAGGWPGSPEMRRFGLWVAGSAAALVLVALLAANTAEQAPATRESAADTPEPVARPQVVRAPRPMPPADVAMPVIRVTAPSDERSEHAGPVVQLRGRVADESATSLTIDGQPVLLGADGAFEREIRLEPGRETTVRLEAWDAAGNVATARRVLVHVPHTAAWEAPLGEAHDARAREDGAGLKAALERAVAEGAPTDRVRELETWLRAWEAAPVLTLEAPVEGATIGGSAEQGYLIGVRGTLATGRTSDRLLVDGQEAPRNASGEFAVTVRRPLSAAAGGKRDLAIVLEVRNGEQIRKQTTLGVRLYFPPPADPASREDLRQNFDNATMRAARKRAAKHVLDALGVDQGGPGAVLRKLTAAEVLVVEGPFDHQERVLADLGIPHTLVQPFDPRLLDGQAFEQARFVFWNSGVHASEQAARRYGPRVRGFVEKGGYLLTSDWALQDVVMHAFPGVLGTTRGTELRELVIDVLPTAAEAGNPLLQGVFQPSLATRWWLEQASQDIVIRKPDEVLVLVEGPALKEHGRSSSLAVTFRQGEGRVLHVVGHYDPERGNLAGAVALQRLALNFVLMGLSATKEKGK